MYTTLSVSTRQHPLIPLDPPTRLTVSSATAQTMRMMLETGIPPQVIAGLLRAAGFAAAHTRYLGGPIILPDSVSSPEIGLHKIVILHINYSDRFQPVCNS